MRGTTFTEEPCLGARQIHPTSPWQSKRTPPSFCSPSVVRASGKENGADGHDLQWTIGGSPLTTLAAMRAAHDEGYGWAVLTSSPMGYNVYAQLGFGEYCQFYVPEYDPVGSG